MRKVKRSSLPSSSSSWSSAYSPYLIIDNFDRERSENLNRLKIMQANLNQSIVDINEDSWRKTSIGYFEKPYGLFKVHFKGLLSDHYETVKNPFGGIGVVIFDERDRCVFELRKPVMVRWDDNREEAGEMMELKALNESLVVVATLGLKRVDVFCDIHSVYEYLTRIRRPSNNKIATLVDELILIQSKLSYRGPFFVRKNGVNSASKLARDAIATQSIKLAKNTSAICTICYICVNSDQMFSVNECLHSYCFSRMKKHVESKLLRGKLPECPHYNCGYKLYVNSCKKFLNQKLYDIFSLRVEEAYIPPTYRVYCPCPTCSALMTKTEVQIFTANNSSSYTRGTGMRKCVKCRHRFCVYCKVPWHYKVSCSSYKESLPYQSSNDAKLKSLATKNGWRECNMCKNIVELAEGCDHIQCRCGYEFCYMCGAEMINHKATCKCLPRFTLYRL